VASHRLLEREEFEQIRFGTGSDMLTPAEFSRITTIWKATTGREVDGFFEYGAGFVKPKNWVGSVAAGAVAIQVVPRGAKALSPADKALLDGNIGDMLHLAISQEAVPAGAGEVSSQGSRYEKAVEALCDLVLRARRGRVLRQYATRSELNRSLRGQLMFPGQALTEIGRPGLFLSRWVELDEDVPPNRFLKAVLLICRQRTGGWLRQRVDDVLAGFDAVSQPEEPFVELSRIRFERLPNDYIQAIHLAKSLMMGEAVGLFAGSVASRSEVVFMSPLFEAFVGKLARDVGKAIGLPAAVKERGRFFAKWESGPHAGTEAVEIVPDAELVDPESGRPVLLIDAKWKWLRPATPGLGIDADDVHQMHAYAARLNCRRAVLVYPWIGRDDPFPGGQPRLRAGRTQSPMWVDVVCVPLMWADLDEAAARFRSRIEQLVEVLAPA
jgi:5-methylcytosine-specific restriction endonuclease McrBC regulatory subunit McrC